MAKKSKQAPATQSKTAGRNPLVTLVVIGLVIAGTILLLERLHDRFRHQEVRPPQETHLPPSDAAAPVKPAPPAAPMPRRSEHAAAMTSTEPRGKPSHHPAAAGGAVAIIIDDMGSSVQEAQTLIDIGVPLTFAVIPGLPKGRAVAGLAHDNSLGVMIHMPMEPKGYPRQRLEANGLLLSHDDDETVRRLNSYFALVPHAAGANNHMGSRFTEDRQKMRLVMTVLKEHNMFFVDSMTSPASAGLSLAREAGIPAAARSVFLDNVQDVAAITAQLRQLVDKARRSGSAIGICHPHRATLQALAQNLPALEGEGIRFVLAAELVR